MEDLIKKLNDLYTELEYETDEETIKQIKKEIKDLEEEIKNV